MPAKRVRNPRRFRRKVHRGAGEVVRFLRTEQVGGIILLAATALALVVANSPLREPYHRLAGLAVGPAALHLDLTVEAWATDGLLTVFFMVAGLELKRELVIGSLRRIRRAALPIFGAVGGMVVPAFVCLAVAAGTPGTGRIWAVPVATDIAFALAILAITARQLPASLRVFLLTLAIVDDLGAILLIATVFTAHIALAPLAGAALVIGGYGLLQRARFPSARGGWLLYLVLGVAAWALLHASGVHATVAGVALGLVTRVRRDHGEQHTPGEVFEHRLQPLSAGVCVPLFAFFAAGVPLSASAVGALFTDRLALAVVAGLVLGKSAGVLGAAALAVRLRLARLPGDLAWRDLAAVSVLTGCGFTVSLLIASLAFRGTGREDLVKTAVLLGSLVASLLSALLLRGRVRARADRLWADPTLAP